MSNCGCSNNKNWEFYAITIQEITLLTLESTNFRNLVGVPNEKESISADRIELLYQFRYSVFYALTSVACFEEIRNNKSGEL